MSNETKTPQPGEYLIVMPCPFCGQSDIDLEGWKNNKGDTGPQCLSCGATCESVIAWNNRVNQPMHDRRAINESFRQWCLEKGQWP